MSPPSDTRRLRSPLTGRYAPKIGSAHRLAAHRLAAEGRSLRAIARALDLHHSSVSAILREPPPDMVLVRALRDEEVLELAAADEEPS